MFAILMMYIGVIVFGTLLSEVQNAISDLYEYQRQRVRVIHQVVPTISVVYRCCHA